MGDRLQVAVASCMLIIRPRVDGARLLILWKWHTSGIYNLREKEVTVFIMSQT